MNSRDFLPGENSTRLLAEEDMKKSGGGGGFMSVLSLWPRPEEG